MQLRKVRMKAYDFGPSYGIGEWIKINEKEGWAQVLSLHWDGYGWKYNVQFEEGLVIEVSEKVILF